jgi:hypothetical protein
MPSYDDVMTALRNADASGNVEDAKRLAQIASRLRSQQTEAPAPSAPKPAVGAPGTVRDITGAPTNISREATLAMIPGSAPPAPPAPEPSFLEKARGAVEAGLSLASGLVNSLPGAVSGFVGGAAGAAEAALRGGPQPGAVNAPGIPAGAQIRGGQSNAGGMMSALNEAMGQGAQAVTYQPSTETGQQYAEKTGEALGPLMATLGAHAGTLAPTTLAAPRVLEATGTAAKRAGAAAVEAAVPPISPQRAANVNAGMEQGLTFAPHQLAENKFVKLAGEAAETTPGAFGGMRQAERQQAFNQALIKHVNPEETATRLTGDVLGAAMDRSGGKIGDITAKTDLPFEDVQGGFAAQRRALARTTEDAQRVVGGYIDEFERLAAENGGNIPGTAFKDLNSDLGREIRANAGNPLGNKLSDLQDVVLDAFRDRLSPEDRATYDTSRMEYAKAKTILPLVAKSVEGDISPGALMNAVTASKAGKEAMGRGRGGDLGDLARAGKYLVEQKSSGTAERSLVYKFILDPLKETAKAATMYPAAAAYNLAGPAIARAMVRKGLKKGGAELPPEEPPPGAGGAAEPPPGGAGPAGGPSTPIDPRLAEVEKLRAQSTDPAVQAALDEHAKTVQKVIAAETAAKKQAASVEALEAAAKATQDPALRKTLQARADKLRAEKIPVGEVTEGQPEIPVEKPGKIPVGKATEGQPEIPVSKPEKVPAGEATEITPEVAPEVTAPPEPLPVGEATELKPTVPVGEATEIAPEVVEPEAPIPVGEATEVTPIPAGEAIYVHQSLFDAAKKRGIETRGRRPSEVRVAVENAVVKEHKLSPQDTERAKAVAKALDIDEKAVENAAVQHERSPRMFDREIDRIIEQGTAQPESAPAAAAPTYQKGNSWVLREKATGKVVMETYDPKKVAALNTEKYEAVPIGEYLAGANRKIKEGAPDAPETKQAVSSGEGPAAGAARAEARPGAGRGGDADIGAQRTGGAVGEGNPDTGRAVGAAAPAGEQPGANRPATPGTERAGDQSGGSSEKRGVDKQGAEYALSVKTEEFGAGREKTKAIMVEARDPQTGERRGFIDFAIRPDGVLTAENAKVAPNFQKRGVAEMMYKAARDAGHDIAPGRVQTDAGQAMVEALQKKGLINKEAEGPRAKASELAAERAAEPLGREAPEDYAARRSLETKKPYIVTGMGHAMLDEPLNRKNAQELGGVAARFVKGEKVEGFEKGAQKKVAPPIAHKDPGEPTEAVTPSVVTQSLSKSTKPAEMRDTLLKQVDDAIAKAPERAADIGTTEPRTVRGKREFSGSRGNLRVEVREGSDGLWHVQDMGRPVIERARGAEIIQASTPRIARQVVESMLSRASRNDKGHIVYGEGGFVKFKVEGDGEFKVLNDPDRLAEFRAKVEKSPGFSNSGQRTQRAPELEGAQRGSGGPANAIANMVDEGDFQAAYDYATFKGIDPATVKLDPKAKARFSSWLKENAEPLD